MLATHGSRVFRHTLVRTVLQSQRRRTTNQAAHTTYFQQSPRRQNPSIIWRLTKSTLLFGVGATVGAVAGAYLLVEAMENKEFTRPDGIQGATWSYVTATRFTNIDADTASFILSMEAPISCNQHWIGHSTSLGSNFPVEDAHCVLSANSVEPGSTPWHYFGVFDGHAGGRLSRALSTMLPVVIDERIQLDRVARESSGQEYTHADIAASIEAVFELVDAGFIANARQFYMSPWVSRETKAMAMFADEGSCALLACYDEANSVVHVANTGDSRAILGRWDPEQRRYVALAMSNDHTGFNKNEVNRLREEHPGEEVVDENTGRTFGIAVTRAFGDLRWKLPNEVVSKAHEQLWASPPRPGGVVKTPPYLTAKPEVHSFDIKMGDRPDFMILASDGLWDQLSNDQAVDLVQRWLEKYKPKDAVLEGPELSTPPEREYTTSDTYYDVDAKCQKWRNEEKYYTVKDEHCGVHLVRNALGGSRDELVADLLSLPPSRSRDARDDITATVVFFGADMAGVPYEDPLLLPRPANLKRIITGYASGDTSPPVPSLGISPTKN